VGDGKHGRAEQIQTFRCQACRTTFSARRDTPFYRLKTPSQQVAVVLSALAEGLDLSAATRVFGFRPATITTWLTRALEHAQTLHERSFCHLWLPHLQLDELRTLYGLRSSSARNPPHIVCKQTGGCSREEFFRESSSVSSTEEGKSTDRRPFCSGCGDPAAARKPEGGITTSLLLVMAG
jgi:hypothetical protein